MRTTAQSAAAKHYFFGRQTVPSSRLAMPSEASCSKMKQKKVRGRKRPKSRGIVHAGSRTREGWEWSFKDITEPARVAPPVPARPDSEVKGIKLQCSKPCLLCVTDWYRHAPSLDLQIFAVFSDRGCWFSVAFCIQSVLQTRYWDHAFLQTLL